MLGEGDGGEAIFLSIKIPNLKKYLGGGGGGGGISELEKGMSDFFFLTN